MSKNALLFLSDRFVVFHCFLTIEIPFQPKPEWKNGMQAPKSFCPKDSGVSETIIGAKWKEFFRNPKRFF